LSIEDNVKEVERLTQRAELCRKQMEELDSQLKELLQIALEQRTAYTRQLFQQKQVELQKQRQGYEEQFHAAQERLKLAQQTANHRQLVEKNADESAVTWWTGKSAI
jgi:hypothetical protein